MSIVEKAREFSKSAHVGQTRKLTDAPYFTHTEGVATIIQEAGLPDEVIAAGYLHDTVEDTDATIEEIKELFGEQVAEIVSGNTEDKTKSWEERKEHTIQELKTASFHVKCLVAADKLDNLRSLIQDSETSQDIWSHFNRGKEKQAWYYKGVADALLMNVDQEIPAYFYEYQKLVNEFFQ